MIHLRPHQQRCFDAMQKHTCGQVIVPTGGGKTYIMIQHALELLKTGHKTIVVVAPRILLANQLCEEFMQFIPQTWTHVCHAHSGETHHFSSTKADKIGLFVNTARASAESAIVFTTYHSLHKVIDSGVPIDCIYYDEAHNGCQKNFFQSVKAVSHIADRKYYFTATPRIGRGVSAERGMTNSKVWGQTIANVSAKELIETGAILPPKVVPFETNRVRNRVNAHQVDADNLMDIMNSLEGDHNKILVSAPSSKILGNMLGHTTILDYFSKEGYQVMHITSKFGAVINGKKVGREEFFNTLQEWGADDNIRFVIFHYSILSEGINVPGLTHTVLLRNLPIIEMAQTIGRVIRVHKDDRKAVADGLIPVGAFHLYKKGYGQVTMPTGYKQGNAIATRLQNVINQIFIEGVPPLAYC